MTDPYRTPGTVVTDDEQRRLWLLEFQFLQMVNGAGQSPDALAKMQARSVELLRLLRR